MIIEEIHFNEFSAGYGPNVERALSAHSHCTYASDYMPEIFLACRKIDLSIQHTKPP